MILQSAGRAFQRENSAGERKRDADFRAAADLAFQLDLAAVVHGGVLDDGKTQPGAAGGFGVALVDAVETLKDPALVLGRDADAGVEDRDDGVLRAAFDVDAHASVGAVILDGVVAEVVKHLV